MNKQKQQDCRYLADWKPGNEICVIIEPAKPGENEEEIIPHSPAEIDAFFNALKALARSHKFELASWGLRGSFESTISKKLIREKIKETVEARDLQLSQLYPEQMAFLKTAALPLPEVSHLEALVDHQTDIADHYAIRYKQPAKQKGETYQEYRNRMAEYTRDVKHNVQAGQDILDNKFSTRAIDPTGKHKP